MKNESLLLGFMALFLAATPAPAAAPDEEPNWIVTVGGGASLRPAFPGAKNLEVRPKPFFGLTRVGRQRHFETPDESFGFAIAGGEGFSLGPVLNLQPGRDEEDAIEGIGDVKRTFEAGAFAEIYASPSVRMRGEVRQGVGGHEGLVSDLGADFITGTPEDPLHFSAGPRVRLADSRFMKAYYGIAPIQAAATRLALHDPKGGVHSAGMLASSVYRFSKVWGIEAYGRYDRLLGDAANSPLVRSSVGSRDQFEAGLGLTYSFGL